METLQFYHYNIYITAYSLEVLKMIQNTCQLLNRKKLLGIIYLPFVNVRPDIISKTRGNKLIIILI